jgi:hypothetical protein
MFASLQPGDHVKARTDLTTGLTDSLYGTPTIRKGRRGIVREVNPGFWRSRCTVEFEQGWTTHTAKVDTSDVVRTFSKGEAAWQRRRELTRGVKLGLLLFNLPLFAAIAIYLLRGHDPVTLAGATIMEGLNMAASIIMAHPFLAAVVGCVGYLVFRARRPR